ncbi:MAG: radical SAM protein [Candidatus Omnitrophica bacterium]|nr:radical SAM protein [Candidatus Omnitrophota bacterium]
MSKILLINPPLPKNELYARGAKATASIIPPLGLASIAAVLEKEGNYVEIIDGIVSPLSLEEIAAHAKKFDFLGITVNTALFKRCIELIKAVKDRDPGKIIIAGGPHASVLPFSLLSKGVDYVVAGEGERTIKELTDALKREDFPALEKIKGIAFMKNGKMVLTEKRPLIENLDDLPMPARHLLPMHLYKTSEARAYRNPCHSLVVSRGCPGTCSFCIKGIFGTKVRYRSPQRIVEEMLILQDKYGAREIAFLDDNFTTKKDIVLEVCRLILASNLHIPWSCEARIDSIDEEMLKMLKIAGCNFVAYGIESGSDEMLKKINKRITTSLIERTVKLTRKAGIPTRGYFILGFVGETEEQMFQTIKFSERLNLDVATFSLLIPFPGTADYERAQKEGGTFDPEFFYKKNIPEFNFLDEPVYSPRNISASRLLEIHKTAYRKFYFRPSFILREILRIRSFEDIKRALKGAETVLKS